MTSLTQHIKTIAPLFFSLVFLATAAGAVPYTGPSGTYPANNTSPVVHAGTTQNIKPGGLSVNAFSAYQDSELAGPTAFIGNIFGSSFLSILLFGGYDSVNGLSRVVTVDASGSIKTTGSLFSDDVATSGSLDPLCATPQGEVVFCGNAVPVGPICGNWTVESGEQCDDGNTTNGDGCSSSCQMEQSVGLMVESIGASAHPVQGGTGNENVSCNATLSGSATNDESVYIRFSYRTEYFGPIYQQDCAVTIQSGYGSGDNYPGQQLSYGGDVEVVSVCFDGGTLPRSPNMWAPQC